VNEDHYVVAEFGRHHSVLMTSLPDEEIQREFREYGYGMVVADGIGGAGSGEAASRLALETLMSLVLMFGKWNLRIDEAIAQEIMNRALRFVRHTDSALAHDNRQPGAVPLRTALTAVWGAGRDLFFCHVGHSRAYLFRSGRLMLLTRDHTVPLNNDRSLTPLIDVSHSARDLTHVVTQSLGMSGPLGPEIDIEHFQVSDKDVILLCTNGLTDTVDEASIAVELASDRAPNDISARLIDLASGRDDVTVLVARYLLPE
jgi:protein phosphatase